MGLTVADFTGKVKCKKCGHRFFKGLKESRTVCPSCGDVKNEGAASSSAIAKAQERNEELEI